MSYAVNIPVATIGQSTTCLTCAIKLPSLESQQQHHKSDWHTYNLKRKMVYLPPVGADVFAQLVTASREQANPQEVPQPECVPCGKKYLSFQAYDNHVNSKKHKQAVIAHAKKNDTEITKSGSNTESTTSKTSSTTNAEKQLDPSETVCLFCSHQAKDAQGNYEHMRSQHGFFLPSAERLIDLPGLLAYLADKVMQEYDCLWCTPSIFSKHLLPDQELQSGFADLRSVRRHMLDKGHCKLAWDQGAEREYADFYLPADSFDKDDDEDENEEAAAKSSEDNSNELDEDEKRLQQVLLDADGNWILDSEQDLPNGIRVDPLTNELVLNNRRLAHKDAVRRQKVESRAVNLASRSSNQSRQQQPAQEEGSDDASNAATSTDGEVSSALLKSQNQLAGVNSLRSDQLPSIATLNADSQDYEATKRSKAANKLSLNANYTSRRYCPSGYGTKV